MALLTAPANGHKNGNGNASQASALGAAAATTDGGAQDFVVGLTGWWQLRSSFGGWHGAQDGAAGAATGMRLTANSPDAPWRAEDFPDGRMLLYSDKIGVHVKDTTSGKIHSVALPEFKVMWELVSGQSHNIGVGSAEAKERTSLWKLSLLVAATEINDDGEYARVSRTEEIAFLRGEYRDAKSGP